MMVAEIGLMTAGVLLLYLGAEALVGGSVKLSGRFGIPQLVVGLVVIAYGTSMPELIVSLEAAWKGASDIAVSNVVGSNICTIGVVLGIAVVIRPVGVTAHLVGRHVPLMIVSTVLLSVVVLDGDVGRVEGAFLMIAIVTYTLVSLRVGRRRSDASPRPDSDDGAVTAGGPLCRDWLLVAAGLVALCLGGDLLIDGATGLATRLKVPEALIGLTLVAVGTSAPDITASVVAAVRGKTDLAVGNAVGSVLFNSTNALGAAALLRPLEGFHLDWVDLAVMVSIAGLSLPLMLSGRLLQRWEGMLLIGFYSFYVVARWDSYRTF